MTNPQRPLPLAVRHPARMALIATLALAALTVVFCLSLGRGGALGPTTALAVQAASGIGLLSGDKIGLRPGFWRNPQRWSIATSNAVYFAVYMYALNPGDAGAIWIWLTAGLAFGLVLAVMAKPAHPGLAQHFQRLDKLGRAGGFGWVQWAHPPITLVLALIVGAMLTGATTGLAHQSLYLAVLLIIGAGAPLYYAPRADGPEAAGWRVLRVINTVSFGAILWIWYGAPSP